MPHPYARRQLQSGSWSAIVGDYLTVFKDTLLLASDPDIHGQLWGNRIYLPVTLRSQ